MGGFAWLHVRFDATEVEPGTQVLVRVEARAPDAPVVTAPDWSFTATLAVVHGSGAPPPPAQRQYRSIGPQSLPPSRLRCLYRVPAHPIGRIGDDDRAITPIDARTFAIYIRVPHPSSGCG